MVLPTKTNIKKVIHECDAVLLGIENMCVNVGSSFSLEEIKDLTSLLKENQTELFICLNKNMHNDDLEHLKYILLELEKLNLTGIFYYDIALVQLKKELNLKTPLVWSQEHLTTNYLTMNYWKDIGVEYTYVSAEITLEEILEIKKNTTMKLVVPIFGYLPMFVSKRHLVKNYQEYFNLNSDFQNYKLFKEDKYYPIEDDSLGTTVYSSHILDGYEEYKLLRENAIDYVTLNSYQIKDDDFIKILKRYNTLNDKDNRWIEETFPNIDKGFLYKETVYRVKKNEKK